MLAIGICVSSIVTGCGMEKNIAEKTEEVTEEGKAGDNKNVSTHEPISIAVSNRDISGFMDLVHETYPEINLEVIPYSGGNYSAYTKGQLVNGDMPDIYMTKVYAPGQIDVSDKLIDLSGYDFASKYAEARLKDVTEDGAVYLLPTYYDCIGITYNKTLLEKHGWTLPTSWKELEELAPKVKAAGCQLALVQLQYAGYGFQYLCNILDTDFLNTIDGRIWQNEFLEGKATVADTPEMMKSMEILDQWRDLGMLNGNGDPTDDAKTKKMMGEGNTLFMLGNAKSFAEDETTDEFGLMPYLSEDGSQNAYILNISRYIGLNKHLEDKGNEQKLEDALHIMEVLSTVEGMRTFNGSFADTSLLPLKDFTVDEDNIYADIQDDLNAGFTAPFIYTGWENIIVDTGEAMLSYIKGEKEVEDIVKLMDEEQPLLFNQVDSSYATVTEKIDNTDCARIVGIATAQASDADLALVSVNKWYEKNDGQSELNSEGVSGELYPCSLTDDMITSIMPTDCWHGDIMTATLTGKKIKELVEEGYDRNKDGKTFPYVLVTPNGLKLEDDTEYTAVIYGATEEVGNLTDTGILGLTAMQQYFSQFKEFSAKDIVWE